MATVALGRKRGKNAEKKMKKNKMVLDLTVDSPSKMSKGINHPAMGVRGRGVVRKGRVLSWNELGKKRRLQW